MSRTYVEKRRQAKKNKTTLQIAAGLLAVILIVGLIVSSNGLPSEVSIQDAYQMRQDGAFVLDVREPDEWQEKHIPGATLIPLGELAAHLDEVPKEQEILVVCRSGNRSQEGRDILLAAGFTKVTSMTGGINEWIAQGYEAEFGQ